MYDLRALFEAMDADGLLAFYVTAATCFTVIVLVQLAQLAWHYAEPWIFRGILRVVSIWLDVKARLYLWWHFRKESECEVSSEMSPASSRMAATALRTQVGRDVHERFKSRLAEQRDSAGEASGGPAALRSMGTYAPVRDRRAQVGVNGNDAA